MTLTDALAEAGYISSAPVEQRMAAIQKVRYSFLLEENEFSRRHAALSNPLVCWICLFPIVKKKNNKNLAPSRDHVIPRAKGGGIVTENIRMAHRYCNTKKQDGPLTRELVRKCRQYLIQHHSVQLTTPEMLRLFVPGTGLRLDLYREDQEIGLHGPVFECRWGAD